MMQANTAGKNSALEMSCKQAWQGKGATDESNGQTCLFMQPCKTWDTAPTIAQNPNVAL